MPAIITSRSLEREALVLRPLDKLGVRRLSVRASPELDEGLSLSKGRPDSLVSECENRAAELSGNCDDYWVLLRDFIGYTSTEISNRH